MKAVTSQGLGFVDSWTIFFPPVVGTAELLPRLTRRRKLRGWRRQERASTSTEKKRIKVDFWGLDDAIGDGGGGEKD